jgi:hypothetical protein
MRIYLPEFKIDVDVICIRTLLIGESASGKTYLYNKIKGALLADRPKIAGIQLLNQDALLTVEGTPVERLKRSKSDMVFIDHGELLFAKFPDLIPYINSDVERQYLIASRVSGDLIYDEDASAILEIKDGWLTLAYPYV